MIKGAQNLTNASAALAVLIAGLADSNAMSEWTTHFQILTTEY
ncbi:hypothetical protein [Sulfitobacter sp.]|jgi:hypothetical protein